METTNNAWIKFVQRTSIALCSCESLLMQQFPQVLQAMGITWCGRCCYGSTRLLLHVANKKTRYRRKRLAGGFHNLSRFFALSSSCTLEQTTYTPKQKTKKKKRNEEPPLASSTPFVLSAPPSFASHARVATIKSLSHPLHAKPFFLLN